MEGIKQKIEARGRLSPEECFALLNSRDFELIRQFISYNHFDNQSEPEFIKLGNLSLIEIYIRKYLLVSEAETEFKKVASPDLMKLYQSLYDNWDWESR